MSVVVLGRTGLLARHVVEELGGAPALGRNEIDFANDTALQQALAGAELVINCAAYTNVDGAERDRDEAERANVDLPKRLVRAAAHAKLVHVSTDFVFDGAQREPYDESVAPNPQSHYARTKWLGEEAMKAHRRLFLVRVQALYGRGGSNFASKLRQLILDGKPLKLDGERRVQPTWVRTAARTIVQLATTTDAYGTYHVSCSGETTWAGFSARLADKVSATPNWKVVRSDELGTPASRPPNCLFRHRALERLGLAMPTWQAAQDEYLAEERAR
jgi:dTDP-4-dehydrorhamnose reductase